MNSTSTWAPIPLASAPAANPCGQIPAAAGFRSRLALGALFYLALVFISYLPMLPGHFLMDDHRLVKDDNGLLNGESGLLSVWFAGDFSLSTVGWWIQWHLWGEHPAGYHVVNLLLQATSAFVLWRLLEQLKIPGAWLAAALFAVHPVCVNSVARMAELKNTLSLPFFLLSFLAYLHYESLALYPAARTDGRGRATLWYAISLLAFVLSLLSKTTSITLPVLLLGAAAWQRRRVTRQDVLHTLPLFVLSLGFGLMSMWYQKHQALVGETLAPSSFLERLATAGWNFWFYLGKALLPVNLSYVYIGWKPDSAHVTAYVPDALVVLTFALAWCFRNSWGRHVLFGLGCFAIALFPALGFIDAQFLVKFQVSDHLQYLPLIAPLVLVTAGLVGILSTRIQILVALALILTLSGFTMLRAQVFSTQENLMRDTLQKNPEAWAAHNDLGVILAQRNNYAEAETHFASSLKYNPDNAEAVVNLSQLLMIEGKFAEARDHLAIAVANHPGNSALHEKLASALAQMGNPPAAIEQLKLALKLAPTTNASSNIRLALAGLLYDSSQYAEAANVYHKILSAKPDLTEPLNNLAWLLATCPDENVRNGAEAVECAERACLLTKFKEPNPLGTLAAAYAEAGRFPEAVITANFAIRQASAARQPQLVAINQQLLMYYRAGRAWHHPPAANQGF
jgi:Flp pilus assembly protein TadD